MNDPKLLEEPTKEETDRIRQGERTVDNLKRLFAVVFAISFGVIGTGVIAKLLPVATSAVISLPTLDVLAVNAEMAAVFIITAGVFYHQSTKFLDIRYAKHPLARAHPYGFALDYATLVLTAAPFFLMAHAFHPDVTHQIGYLWFFGAYVLLLAFGLMLLVLQQIRHMPLVRGFILNETIPETELERDVNLRTYWLVMNSGILLLLCVLFGFFSTFVMRCPVAPQAGEPFWFLYAFGAIALLRDVLDYRYSWRFTFPIPAEGAEKLDKWPLTLIVASTRKWLWVLGGYVLIALTAVVAFQLEFWNIPRWVAACTL